MKVNEAKISVVEASSNEMRPGRCRLLER
jgi:hypothetical protein